jgi:hypothetical protein
MKNEKYMCPVCAQAEGQSLNKNMYEGLTAKGEVKDLLVVAFECPKCRAVWDEVFILKYDGFCHKNCEYDSEGALLVDWQNEIITEKGMKR